MNRRSLSVLCDLRPAFDGFVGISHETRLMFSLFHELEDVEVTGLIHHPGRPLARVPSRDETDERKGKPARNIQALSRFVASTMPRSGAWSRLRDNVETARDYFWLQLLATVGVRIGSTASTARCLATFFGARCSPPTLPAADFERCRTARYASLWSPWSAMHANALFPWSRKYAKVGTSAYDVLVAQTPWPGRVAPQTRLVIRYHDAVPVFLPHTIKRPRLHYFLHLAALEQNAKSAVFACVSEYSRTSLLQIFPRLEKQAFVVSDCIADDYYPDAPRHGAVASIITSRIDASTEPQLSPMGARVSLLQFQCRTGGLPLPACGLDPGAAQEPPCPPFGLGDAALEIQATDRAGVCRIVGVGPLCRAAGHAAGGSCAASCFISPRCPAVRNASSLIRRLKRSSALRYPRGSIFRVLKPCAAGRRWRRRTYPFIARCWVSGIVFRRLLHHQYLRHPDASPDGRRRGSGITREG